MRSEQEMLELIMNTALGDERIRAVLLNGSRANPNAPRDIFQDFDIVYFVTDIKPFVEDANWIDRFGELMIMQLPETMIDPPAMNDGHFAYLMQFMDGNRIDLSLFSLDQIASFDPESSTVVLLDKDKILPVFPPASDDAYIPRLPSQKLFSDCCNEFWWVSAYVAKGLWREEMPYAKFMLDQVMREELTKMLAWYIGMKTRFSINPGKMGKYFRKYLPPELWQTLEATYTDAGYENNWQALFSMCELFRNTAQSVASQFDLSYPLDDDRKVSAHLRHVWKLPKDAKQIY